MAAHQNKLSRFWQELKRRRVLHVITVYASAAFVIIELIGNLTEPLNLPTSLSTIVIIVLAVGFPLAIILSWLYDLTSGTFERTKPMEDIPEGEKARIPNAWKIATYLSFVVIAGLVVLNIATRGDLIKPGMIKSMVILPFDNYTGDENLDYVASGMHASLIGDIGKVSALRVIGKTSSNVFKETDKSAPDIAKELNVDMVLEPTLTCYGDTVCILVRAMANFPEEKQIWVAEYREDKSKILSLWNRIAKQIAEEVKVELTPEEVSLLADARLVDKDAYDAYLQSHMYWDDLSKEGLEKAIDYLNIAVEKDPTWAPIYSGLAKVWMSLAQMGYTSPDVAGPKIFENIQKAMGLDPNLSDLHFTVALIASLTEWDWEKAEKEFLQTLAINPNDALSRIFYAHLLMFLQRNDEALSQAKRAVELDPLNSNILALNAALLGFTGDYQASLQQMEKALEIDPGNLFVYSNLDIMAFNCGEYDKAIEYALFFMPFEDAIKKNIQEEYDEHGVKNAFELILNELENLNQEGLFALTTLDMSVRYVMVGNYNKAVDWIERGYEIHDPNQPYINTDLVMVDEIATDPRIIDIIEKMNLPLPKTN